MPSFKLASITQLTKSEEGTDELLLETKLEDASLEELTAADEDDEAISLELASLETSELWLLTTTALLEEAAELLTGAMLLATTLDDATASLLIARDELLSVIAELGVLPVSSGPATQAVNNNPSDAVQAACNSRGKHVLINGHFINNL